VGFFRYGELPLVLLALLGQRAMNGYEMLGELGRLFSPGYAPSPGSVYPAMSALRKSGLIGAKVDNGKRRYELTPAGGEALATRRAQLSAIEARCWYGSGPLRWQASTGRPQPASQATTSPGSG
jgi:DNA-binding PadR family transcriptional regulator